MFLVLACISLIIFELSFFMILAFKTKRSDGHLSLFVFGWFLWSRGVVFHHCTCGLSGSGGRLV